MQFLYQALKILLILFECSALYFLFLTNGMSAISFHFVMVNFLESHVKPKEDQVLFVYD